MESNFFQMLGYLTLRTQMLHCFAADDGKAVSGRNGTPRSSIPPASPKGTQGQDATIRGGPRFGVRVRQKSPKIAPEARVNRPDFADNIFGLVSITGGVSSLEMSLPVAFRGGRISPDLLRLKF